jgi:hypothetical protein
LESQPKGFPKIERRLNPFKASAAEFAFACALRWVDALLQEVRNLFDIYSKNKINQRSKNYGITRLNTQRS